MFDHNLKVYHIFKIINFNQTYLIINVFVVEFELLQKFLWKHAFKVWSNQLYTSNNKSLSVMSHLTGDSIWDIFVIYIFGSIGFLFSCCLILACLFVFSPADDRSGLKRRSTSRNRQASAAKRNTIHRMEQKFDTVVELAHSKSTRAQSLLWECSSQKNYSRWKSKRK